MVREPGGLEYCTGRFVQDTECSATPHSSLVSGCGIRVSLYRDGHTSTHLFIGSLDFCYNATALDMFH